MKSYRAYAIETGTDGGKSVHSFNSKAERDAWVATNPNTREATVSNTKTVSAAIYAEAVIKHLA